MSDKPRLRLLFDVHNDLLEAALRCEADVFLASFGNTAEELDAAYRPYRAQTRFLALADEAGEVLGAIRLTFPGPAGSPTLTELSRPPWSVDPVRSAAEAGLDPATTLDGTTIALRPELRGHRRPEQAGSHALMYGLFAAARANGLTTVTTLVDAVPEGLMRSLGLIFTALPGSSPQPYFGSPATTPVYAHLDPLFAGQRELDPAANRRFEHGLDLPGIEVPPAEAFRIRPDVIDLRSQDEATVAQLAESADRGSVLGGR